MGSAALLGLAALALVDSTSVGTLVLPLLMLVHPRVRPARVLLYLATISLFYLALGGALLAGADLVVGLGSALDGGGTVDLVQLGVGLALLLLSFWPDTPWAKRNAARREAAGEPGRAQRWADLVATSAGRPRAVVGVALAAGLIEAASMVPYLGAVALISTSDLGSTASFSVLVAYVALMTLPALVLLGLRVALHERITSRLTHLSAWLTARTSSALWWVIGIVGFLLAADAASRVF